MRKKDFLIKFFIYMSFGAIECYILAKADKDKKTLK
jgi:hypothetical protein